MYQNANNRKWGVFVRKKRLGELSDVMVGLVLKRKEANSRDTNKVIYKLLTLKSFNSEGWIDKNYLDDFESLEILDERYLSLEDDVIIRLTQPYTAVTITKDFVGCVVPSQFVIVRLLEKRHVPGYLTLYLNSERVKKHIELAATGITVPMIKTGTLRDLEIPILKQEKQKKIAEINKLIIQERHLLYKMIVVKEKYYQALTETLLMEGNEDE